MGLIIALNFVTFYVGFYVGSLLSIRRQEDETRKIMKQCKECFESSQKELRTLQNLLKETTSSNSQQKLGQPL